MKRSRSRGATLVEMTLVAAILLLLAAAFGVPGYRSYADSRANRDAAAVLASDLSFLVRAAQNAPDEQGTTLVVESTAPFAYGGYLGRPRNLDPRTRLGTKLFERSFPHVHLSEDPINAQTPLLFASNGSAQYETANGVIAPQHATIDFVLSGGSGKPATVTLDLYTGAVQTGF
jgi:type II secretory pathway pseudopilin PulG